MWKGRTILLLNSHADAIELISDWFGALGAVVQHARTVSLCEDLAYARTMLEMSRPDAILFDLAVPYDQNWRCLRKLVAVGLFDDIPLVLTTVNRRALESIVGPTDAFEIIGTPHDLWRLQDVVDWHIASRQQMVSKSRQ
jgi:CheY-like chemotaxis protein